MSRSCTSHKTNTGRIAQAKSDTMDVADKKKVIALSTSGLLQVPAVRSQLAATVVHRDSNATVTVMVAAVLRAITVYSIVL